MFFLILLCRFYYVYSAVDPSRCASCASPMLKGNWHITGLPSYSSEMTFDDSCLFLSAHRMNSSCSGLCMEMTFPFDGAAQIVRGCYEDFFKATRAPEEVEQCEFSIGNETTLIGITSTDTPVTSVRFCDWNKQNDALQACNTKFFTTSMVNSPGTLWGDRTDITRFCSKEIRQATLTCKSCARYGGNGQCSHKTTSTCSTGRYCVKVKGNAGSNQIDVRGCAQISPYSKSTSYCTRIKTQIENKAIFGLQATKEDFDADVCYCNDQDSCNQSMRNGIEIGIFTFLFFVIYF